MQCQKSLWERHWHNYSSQNNFPVGASKSGLLFSSFQDGEVCWSVRSSVLITLPSKAWSCSFNFTHFVTEVIGEQDILTNADKNAIKFGVDIHGPQKINLYFLGPPDFSSNINISYHIISSSSGQNLSSPKPATILLRLKNPLQNVLEICSAYWWSPEDESCWLWWPPLPDLTWPVVPLLGYTGNLIDRLPWNSLSTFLLPRGWSLYVWPSGDQNVTDTTYLII